MSDEHGSDQLELIPALARSRARAARRQGTPEKPPAALAEVDPVARVLVDVPLAHLDRPFDYAVPAAYADQAVPGARVKVRFAGQDVDGYVVDRVAASDHPGRLQPLRRVVSPEPVLTPEIAELSATVAARYAGTRSDVLRLAVPARHATTEKKPSPQPAVVDVAPRLEVWRAYPDGTAFLTGLAAGEDPRAVWSAVPGDDWAALLVEAVVAVAASGRGALVCVPDHRDVARLDQALTERLGAGTHAVLTADAGPARRYASFLSIVRGTVRVVIGTRAAAFAPVHDLGLVAIWDDGDDLYAEPRAPYPHAREVLLLRAEATGCAALVGAHARSVEAQYLLHTGWAREIAAPRDVVRQRVSVAVTGAGDFDLARDPAARSARLPHEALELVRSALETGPVLLQTPRSGYATRLACERCRTPATCTRCHGPLRIVAARRPPECAWCATSVRDWACAECGGRGLRAPVLGDRRTAEEIGRAFPGVPVVTSSGDKVLAEVPGKRAVVVATPGAEPVAEGGYAAVLLLDTWLLLARSDLRAAEEAVRRWANAAALVRPAAQGGRVLAVGDPSTPALQALVRWDAAGFAEREIVERQSAHLPPASRVATLAGAAEDLADALASLQLPAAAEVLGPAPADVPGRAAAEALGPAGTVEDEVRYVVRVPRRSGPALSATLVALQVHRATRKLPHLRVQVDPPSLG